MPWSEAYIMLTHRHSFILYLTLNHRAMHNAYMVTNPSAFWKGHRLCTWKGFFRNSWTWWGAVKSILPPNKLLKFWLWTVSLPLAAFVLLEISRLTWHKSDKHDQITKYSNPFRPLPLGGGKEGVKAAPGKPIWSLSSLISLKQQRRPNQLKLGLPNQNHIRTHWKGYLAGRNERKVHW